MFLIILFPSEADKSMQMLLTQVDDVPLVHVLHSFTNLPHVVDHLRLRHCVTLGSDPFEELAARQAGI